MRSAGLVAKGELRVTRQGLVFTRESSRRTWGSLCAELIIDGLSLPAAAGGITLAVMGGGEIADGRDVGFPVAKIAVGALLMGAAAARFYYLPDPQVEGVAFADRTFHLTMRPKDGAAKLLVKAVQEAIQAEVGPRLVLRVTNLIWGADQMSNGQVSFGNMSAPMVFYSAEP